MSENKRYSISEFRRMLGEGNEFKPVMGKDVVASDKRENDKAVNDIMSETGAKPQKEVDKSHDVKEDAMADLNKTTLDLEFTTEPNEEYKKNVEAQAEGFASALDKEKSEAEDNESLEFDGARKFYEKNKEKNKELNKIKTDTKHAGLKSRELPKSAFAANTLFKESKTMKRLKFNKTVFLTESQVAQRVPEEYKVDKNRFIMADRNGNEFLVECSTDNLFKAPQLTITPFVNESMVNESIDRMNALAGYTSKQGGNNLSSKKRLEENTKFGELLENMRKIADENKQPLAD